MERRTFILAGGAAILAGGWALTRPDGGNNLLAGMAEAQSAGGDPAAVAEMVLGDPAAAVEIIEYASFTCPHCATFHDQVYPQLKADYIDTGKVRFVYREVYFDRFGLWASMIARCGGAERFFPIAEMIYDKQREWTSSGDPATIAQELRKIGALAGLDGGTLDACMSDAAKAQNLVAWFEQNANADDINSTPSFVIDGTKYSNMAYAEMQAILDEKLAG